MKRTIIIAANKEHLISLLRDFKIGGWKVVGYGDKSVEMESENGTNRIMIKEG